MLTNAVPPPPKLPERLRALLALGFADPIESAGIRSVV